MADEPIEQPIVSEPEVTAPAPEQPGASLLDAFRGRGVDVSGYENDDALFGALNNSISELQQMRELQPVVQQYMQNRDEFTSWREAQKAEQAAQKQQQEAAAKAPKWKLPDYESDWDHLTKWDEQTGRYVAVSPYVSPQVAEKRNAYERSYLESMRKLVSNPADAVWKDAGLEDMVRGVITEEFNKYQEQQSRSNGVTQQLEGVVERAYQYGADGRPVASGVDANGVPQYVLSPYGQALTFYAKQAKDQLGIADPQHQVAYAQRMADAHELHQMVQQGQVGAQPGQQPSIEQQNEQGKETFLQRGGRTHVDTPANRDGTVVNANTNPGVVQNEEATVRELLQQELRKRGFSVP